MRNYRWIWFILLLSGLLVGFTHKPPLPVEGIYNVKLREFTFFDLATDELGGISGIQAELTESKPDYLKISPELEQIKTVRYGSFKIGNAEQKIWFLMAKDRLGLWSELYIDQNSDHLIAVNEKTRGIETLAGKEKGNEYYAAITKIPPPIRVTFKGMNTEIQKKQYFFVEMVTFYKNVELDCMVKLYSSSFLNGEMEAVIGKEVKLVKFRIIDANGNGCFNDYGNDWLMIDANSDGYFTAKEVWPLTEYFTVTGPDKQKKQLRMVVAPHPAKIAVVGATDNIDWSQLEPVSDPKDE